MASGFFAILDDVVVLLDDISAMSKIATKKTAGILGDDLAVNAEKASGFASSRELPVLWAISKGSLLNKIIILPIAFLLSAFFPIAIKIILVLGGLYLAYEGVEKIYEYLFHSKKNELQELKATASDPLKQPNEKQKIKSAIFTDFILSIEIIIIALGTVLDQPLLTRILVVSTVSLIATVGVYGIVALIIRMDEFGASLINMQEGDNKLSDKVGRFLVSSLPYVIKGLSIVGTAALITVAGGIFSHSFPDLFHSENIPSIVIEIALGLLGGILMLLLVSFGKLLFKKSK
ncbi:DUF808 family protein [Aquimarina agarilytica]|uniref:DUF808 family protein n=1 Tax=Aquimarina agarilytica TaxID=1087449 RepID=UPI00028889FD|nr:DUF808 family protein [Aquimarina agarilytica]